LEGKGGGRERWYPNARRHEAKDHHKKGWGCRRLLPGVNGWPPKKRQNRGGGWGG